MSGFEVRVTFPIPDDDLEEMFAIGDRLENVASPYISSFSGCGQCRDMSGGREIGFIVETFDDAMKLKKQLEDSGEDNLIVIVREK